MSTSANTKPASPAQCKTKFWRCWPRQATINSRSPRHSIGIGFAQKSSDRKRTAKNCMPEENTETASAPQPQAAPTAHSESKRATLALVAAAAAWLVPGLGHALLKMWGRALAIFFTVGLLVILGSGMRGNIFPPND